jgi:fructose-bisphosphate aldolase class I
LTFSFERALEEPALFAWEGKDENIKKAQNVLLHRAKMNSLASKGEYSGEEEKGADI